MSATPASTSRPAWVPAPRTLRKAAIYLGLWVAFVWAVFPFYWMVVTSVRPSAEVFQRPPALVPSGITVNHYLELLVGAEFWRFALNSVVLTLTVTVASVIVSVTAGYAMARYRFRGSVALPLLMLYGQMDTSNNRQTGWC